MGSSKTLKDTIYELDNLVTYMYLLVSYLLTDEDDLSDVRRSLNEPTPLSNGNRNMYIYERSDEEVTNC